MSQSAVVTNTIDQSSAELPESVPSQAAQSPVPSNRLLKWQGDTETTAMRIVGWVLALAITVGFFIFVHHYFAPGPGNPGIDENAYLVAGKNIAHHLTPGMHPTDPFEYVGPMWIVTSNGSYYPKYPSGLPLLNAIAIWASGGHNSAAYYVSPICASLAVLGMFLLTRLLAGSFWGILAALVLATNATMLHLSIIPSSHAPAIAFSLWGIYLMLCWWRSGKLWIGVAAGFLLGYTCTIRYTEGLLLLPLAFVAIAMLRWTKWRSYLRSAVPLLAWLTPVAALVIFNHIATGHWTGYDSTHESTGFTLAEFERKWQYTIAELYLYGLFLLLPLGLLGMMFLFSRSWKIATMLVLWFVPPVLLYTAYYWGQQTPGVGFLRFFLTLFPPIIAAGIWFMAIAGQGLLRHRDHLKNSAFSPPPAPAGAFPALPLAVPLSPFTLHTSPFIPRRLSITAAISASLITAAICAVGILVQLPDLKFQHTYNVNAAYSASQLNNAIGKTAPASKSEPLLLCEGSAGRGFNPLGARLLMQMQFDVDGKWYMSSAFEKPDERSRNNLFNRGGGRRGNWAGGPPNGNNNPNDPDPNDAPVLIQPERVAQQKKFYAETTKQELDTRETQLIGDALDSGRAVFELTTPSGAFEKMRTLRNLGFECRTVAQWKEPLRDDPPTETNGDPRNGPPGNRGGGGANPMRRLMMSRDTGGLAAPARELMRGEEPRELQVVQITRRPPTTSTAAR